MRLMTQGALGDQTTVSAGIAADALAIQAFVELTFTGLLFQYLSERSHRTLRLYRRPHGTYQTGKTVALKDLESWLRPPRNSSSERLRSNVPPRAFREALGEFLGVSPD